MEESLNQLKEVVQNPKKVHPVKYALKTFHKNPKFYITSFVWSIISTAVGIGLFLNQERILAERKAQNLALQEDNKKSEKLITELKLKSDYSHTINLENKISQMNSIYADVLKADEILDSLPQNSETTTLKSRLNSVRVMISKGDFLSASSELRTILDSAKAKQESLKKR